MYKHVHVHVFASVYKCVCLLVQTRVITQASYLASDLYCMYMYICTLYMGICTCTCMYVCTCSMDGFRVVKLDSVLPQIDILITATGTGIYTHVYTCMTTCAILSLSLPLPPSLPPSLLPSPPSLPPSLLPFSNRD